MPILWRITCVPARRNGSSLSKEAIFEAVDRFYRACYLRPKPILRIIKTMLEDNRFITSYLFGLRMGSAGLQDGYQTVI